MEVCLPFSGFYESIWSSEVDWCEEQEVERIAEEHGISKKELWDIFYRHSKYHRAYEKIAEEYVGYFADMMGVKLTFNIMNSPREYNFTTDRIFADISVADAYNLYRQAGKKKVRTMAKKMFTSYDGFISYYSSNIDDWGELYTWDHNQLLCMLEALMEEDFEYSLLEDMNEVIFNAYRACVDWNEVYLEIGKLIGATEESDHIYPTVRKKHRGLCEAVQPNEWSVKMNELESVEGQLAEANESVKRLIVENERLLKLVEQTRVVNEKLETRLSDIQSVLGISALENRIRELENQFGEESDAFSKSWVKKTIENALENFDVEDALQNGYKTYITSDDYNFDDMITKDDVEDIIKETVRNMTFIVEGD